MKLTKESRYNDELTKELYTQSIIEGIYIDVDVANKVYESLIEESEEFAYQAIIQLPEEFHGINLNSPKQVSEVLVDHYGLAKFATKTKTGGLSFGEGVLAKIYEKTGNLFAYNLREHRSKKSIASKVKEVLGYLDENNRVHPEIAFGETNRVSYKKPALSNLHESCRPMLAAGPGRKLIKADYKAQEVYIQLNMLNIPELKKVFDECEDFYTGMVKQLAGVELNPEYRDNIKTAWLAGIYNSSLRGLGQNKEEKALIKLIKEKVHTIPQVEQFRELIKERIAKGDRVVESYFGTTREISDWVKSYSIQNIAFNNTFQITGADILFFAMESCNNKFKALEYDFDDIHIYMTIHDEIIFSVNDKLLVNSKCEEELLNHITDAMVLDIEGWTKIKVKLEVSDTY